MQTHPWTARPSSPPGGDSTYFMNRQRKTNGSPDRSQPAKKEATRTLKRGSLNREDEASYELYQQRFSERYRVGEQADRLVQIVDRYMPRTADENRACVMHYPDKVGEMLRCSKRPGSFARRFERGKVGGRYFRSSKAWRTAARKSPTQCRRTCDDERSS